MQKFLYLLLLSIFLSSSLVNAENKNLRIGLTGKYPPFNYYNSEGTLVGFDVDVAKYICSELKRPCEFVILQWDGILAALLAEKIDVIIGSMAITPEREKNALFSQPYYESGAQIFSKNSHANPDEKNFRVGVTLGTTYESAFRKNYPKAIVRTYKGDTEILQDIEAGRLDGIVTDLLVGSHMIREFGAPIKPIGTPLYLEKMGIPARKNEPQLIYSINVAIERLRSSPTYAELMAQHFGIAKNDSAKKNPDSLSSTNSFRNYSLLLWKGLKATVQVSFLGLAIGLCLSLFFAFLMAGTPQIIGKTIRTFTDLIRSTPFLIQLFAVYFGLPAIGISIPPFLAAICTIGAHSSAYLSEVILSGYYAIPLQQRQAGQVLGLNKLQTLWHIVFPQMLPIIVAPCLNTIVAMIKDSAIVSVISVYELTMQTQQLVSATYRPFEFYIAAAALYAAITYPLLLLGRRFECRTKI